MYAHLSHLFLIGVIDIILLYRWHNEIPCGRKVNSLMRPCCAIPEPPNTHRSKIRTKGWKLCIKEKNHITLGFRVFLFRKTWPINDQLFLLDALFGNVFPPKGWSKSSQKWG